MTHLDIIWIVVTLTISLTLKVYVAIKIKYIYIYTRPSVNTLVILGDIKLVDYIEPTQPQWVFNYPNLLDSQIYERISNNIDYWKVPSYFSEASPSYQTVDQGYIYFCLENSINLDFILILLIFLFLLVFILYLFCFFVFKKTKKI